MAQQTKRPSTQVVRKWRMLIAEWRESGLTAREFCKTKWIKSYTTLHVWSGKLRGDKGYVLADASNVYERLYEEERNTSPLLRYIDNL